METRITPDWLRNKIETEPDSEVEAGIPAHLLQAVDMFLPPDSVQEDPAYEERALRLRHAFGLFVRSLRLQKGMTIEALANAASVLVEDIEKMEQDPHSKVRPRTAVHLARVFDILPERMISLAGLATAIDGDLENEALQFAAKSDGISSLNRKERQLLREFVRYLNKA